MPPLLLDDEEAVAIAVGLRTAARQAVAGIDEASVITRRPPERTAGPPGRASDGAGTW